MKTLLIEYDLSKPGQNYPGLIDYIKSVPNWAHHLKSGWMIKTNLTPIELRDKLKGFMDKNDKVIVIDITSDAAAWSGLSKELSDWIRRHL